MIKLTLSIFILVSFSLVLVTGVVFAQQPTLDDLKDAVPESFVQKMKNFFKFIWSSFLAILRGAGEVVGLIFDAGADALHRMLELPPFQNAYD